VLNQLSAMLTDAENLNQRPGPGLLAAASCPPYDVWCGPSLHQLPVLSYPELVGADQVRSVGVVSADRMAVTA